jgi:hypothetical protein
VNGETCRLEFDQRGSTGRQMTKVDLSLKSVNVSGSALRVGLVNVLGATDSRRKIRGSPNVTNL